MPEFAVAQEPMLADHGYPPAAMTAAAAAAALVALGRALAGVLAEPREDAFAGRLAVLLGVQDCRPPSDQA